MLQRNLLYTAVTRGKQLVIIVGSQKAIGMAVEREEAGERCSLLRQRLLAAFEESLPGAENSGGRAQ